MEFFNIKLHTEYSLLEGVGSVDEYVSKAKKLNQKYLGITDTSLFATYSFFDICLKNDIKPIIGLEVYVRGICLDGYYALTLIAKNNQGLKDIYKLSTISYEKKIGDRLLLDLDDIYNYQENLFMLTGGIKGEFLASILDDNVLASKEILNTLKDKIKDIYLEIPVVDLKEKYISKIYEVYKEMGLKTVLTSDVYYVEKEDKILQKIFATIKENSNLSNVRGDIKNNDVYFKSIKDIKNIYPEDLEKEGLENLKYIVENSNAHIEKLKTEFPNIDISKGMSDREYIEYEINKKFNLKYSKDNKVAKERLKYELDIIENMGYIRYFLVVKDFIKYAKENNIYVGPGRGSAAGSIVSYLLDITEIDPLKYDLIFERFLNPQRISMPDIDVDIEQEKRPELISYIQKKYGIRNVSQIITFSTYKPALAIRDVARCLNLSDKLIKPLLDDVKKGILLKDLKTNKEDLQNLIKIAIRIENKPKNLSTHASGVIISKDDMRDNLPLMYDSYTSSYQIQFEAEILEKLGYIKFDILGLKNLNIVKSSVEKSGSHVDIYNLPRDKKAYQIMNEGNNLGIFQCESRGITELGKKLKINSLDDIALLLALYRPGPLGSGYIDKMIEIKNKNLDIEYIDPILEETLKSTYGVIVYQEQVMQIASLVSGYTLAEADELRKAIGKKNQDLLDKNRKIFLSRAKIDKKKAEKIYDLIENFGNYGFNKAHAVSYATITYQTAYFKANYPKEFYSAILSSELKSETKLQSAYLEMMSKDIEMLEPSINKSFDNYVVEGKGVRMPLSSLKNMSEKTALDIVKERENGTFKSFEDFYTRCSFLNKNNLQSLIYSGCFDELNYTRRTLIENLEDIVKWGKEKLKNKKDAMYSEIFLKINVEEKDYVMKTRDEYEEKELIAYEKEYIGISFRIYRKIKENIFSKVVSMDNGYLIGNISNLYIKVTKSNELMAELIITTLNGVKKYKIFTKMYKKYEKEIINGKTIIFKSAPLNDGTFAINEAYGVENLSGFTLCLKIEDENFKKREDLINVITNNKGTNFIKIYKKNKNKYDVIKMKSIYNIALTKEVLLQLEELIGIENIRIIRNLT